MTEPLIVIDTFSGIGGLSYAAEKLVGGFQTIQFVEPESYCQKVLKKHWPNVPIHDDIKTYNPEPYSADVICGGFPCQDISTAGKGLGITKETRSGLFYELIRVIRLVRPKYIILENVAAILNNGLGIVLGELASAGFDCEYACIPASALGACHIRDRWWLVATNSEHYGSSRAEGSKGDEQTSKTTTRKKVTVESERNSKSPFNESFSRVAGKWKPTSFMLSPRWREYKSKCAIRRGDDGVSDWVHRNSRIRALANSVVPQVAAIPFQRVKELSLLQNITIHTH